MSEKRPRNGDFPKWPDECKRHRWLPVIDLRSGKPIANAVDRCWWCGTERAVTGGLPA